MEKDFCQSCGMPMEAELYGTETDGSKSADYCHYCYQRGAFTYEGDVEGMISICVAPMVEHNPGMTEEAAAGMMRSFLPTLKRWRAE